VGSGVKAVLAYPLILTLALTSCSPRTFTGEQLLAGSSQHVLVIVGADRDSTGWLYRYSNEQGQWTAAGDPVPVTVGAGGVAKQREGDKRAPTGAYPLTSAFGYAETPPAGLRMPYLPLRPETECVDDAGSRFYNQVVNPSEVGGRSWSSSEMMRRDLNSHDDLYQLGLLVAYNPEGAKDPTTGKGAGSCIFLHIWRSPTNPTVGCTAMPEAAMQTLLSWLDPRQKPILVQGSRADLERLAQSGKLPYPLPPKRLG
jgi:L,D-peptidoglycan transpeptidase YkuD (ErfK/YbiS/YcfS/YnhG family)